MNVKILKPYGYCAGVMQAINLIKSVAKSNDDLPIYCIGQIVHNDIVNEVIASLGVNVLTGDKDKLIDSIDRGIVIFQAHGTDNKIVEKASKKELIVYDAICSFVKKDFDLIKSKLNDGYSVIYIGKKGHPESEAALSISPDIFFIEKEDDVNYLHIDNDKICVTNQTTLSLHDIANIHSKIKEKYPQTELIDEICSFTRIRQEHLLVELKNDYDGIIVVGGHNSNNVKSLHELAVENGKDAIIVDRKENLDHSFLDNKNNILLVSGASTPNFLVDDIYEYLTKL